MSKETNQYIEPTTGDNLPTESIEMFLRAAKYGYDYHSSTQFPEMSFDDNCKNNFLQALSNWQKSQPDNRGMVTNEASELAEEAYGVDPNMYAAQRDGFKVGHSTATQSFQSKLEERIKELTDGVIGECSDYTEMSANIRILELKSFLKYIKGE